MAKRAGGYADLADLRRRAGVSAAALDRLARADAFGLLALDRRGATWRANTDRTGHELDLPPLFAWAEGVRRPQSWDVALWRMTLGQEVAEDYANLRLTLRCHPLALLRPWLGRRVIKAARLAEIDDAAGSRSPAWLWSASARHRERRHLHHHRDQERGRQSGGGRRCSERRRVVLGAQLLAVRGRVKRAW